MSNLTPRPVAFIGRIIIMAVRTVPAFVYGLLTALFIVLPLEQGKKKDNRAAGIIGMVCTAASLAVFGPDNFLTS